MANYRGVAHYYFKPGKEEEGLKFVENELVKKAQEYGCHYVEVWKSEKDPSHLVGIGTWNSLEDAKRFQSLWNSKEKELGNLCKEPPKREFFKLHTSYTEKAKKVA